MGKYDNRKRVEDVPAEPQKARDVVTKTRKILGLQILERDFDDFVTVANEMKVKNNVLFQILWNEYKANHPDLGLPVYPLETRKGTQQD